MVSNNIGLLPAPFRPKAVVPVPYTMQVALIAKEGEDGHKTLALLKEFVFEPMEDRARLTSGARDVYFGTKTRAGSKALQYMPDKLNGRQIRCYTFEDGAENKLAPEAAIDEAFDCILAKAPRRECTDLAQSRWVKKQMNDPDSPIYAAKFNIGDMSAALKRIRDLELQANIVVQYPFFLGEFEGQSNPILAFLHCSRLSNAEGAESQRACQTDAIGLMDVRRVPSPRHPLTSSRWRRVHSRGRTAWTTRTPPHHAMEGIVRHGTPQSQHKIEVGCFVLPWGATQGCRRQ